MKTTDDKNRSTKIKLKVANVFKILSQDKVEGMKWRKFESGG